MVEVVDEFAGRAVDRGQGKAIDQAFVKEGLEVAVIVFSSSRVFTSLAMASNWLVCWSRSLLWASSFSLMGLNSSLRRLLIPSSVMLDINDGRLMVKEA